MIEKEKLCQQMDNLLQEITSQQLEKQRQNQEDRVLIQQQKQEFSRIEENILSEKNMNVKL